MFQRLLTVLAGACLLSSTGAAQTPAQRLATVHAEATTILDGGRVLIVALAPAREDLAIVAYYRTVPRAQVRVAYLTNGEATVPDGSIRYPHEVAAELRRLAAASTEDLGAEHSFLNFTAPDGVASDSTLRLAWPVDTLRTGLRREVDEFQPDLVLLDGFDRPEVPPAVLALVRSTMDDAVDRASRMGRFTPSVVAWGASSKQGVHDWLRRSRSSAVRNAMARGLEVDARYRSWREAVPRLDQTYYRSRPVPSTQSQGVSDLRALLRRPMPKAFAALDSQLKDFARDVRLWKRIPTGRAFAEALRRPVSHLREIDKAFTSTLYNGLLERRILMDWRASLEEIRTSLLDAKVYWRVSDSVVTNLQVAFLTIDSLQGVDAKGQTQIFFPMVQRGWALNEALSHTATVEPGTTYRILSARDIEYDLPREMEGLKQRRYRTPWYFFVVHQASDPERSFSLRLDAGFLGAPRFSVDVLWPVVSAVSGDEIVVRLTNNSRDGVRDSLRVTSAHVRAKPTFFRLNAKGSSQVDTIALEFSKDLPAGPHLGSLSIGWQEVGRFLARKFPVAVDTVRQVILLEPSRPSVTGKTLKRMGLPLRSVSARPLDSSALAGASVLLIPEWSGGSLSATDWTLVRSFVEQGGHAVVLAQHPGVARELPGGPIVESLPDGSTDSTSAVNVVAGQDLVAPPNDLTDETWEGWLHRRVTHRLTLRPGVADTLATVGPERLPAVLQWPVGRGRMSYVNLNLHHQFLNVHPGALRLLANVLAVRP